MVLDYRSNGLNLRRLGNGLRRGIGEKRRNRPRWPNKGIKGGVSAEVKFGEGVLVGPRKKRGEGACWVFKGGCVSAVEAEAESEEVLKGKKVSSNWTCRDI